MLSENELQGIRRSTNTLIPSLLLYKFICEIIQLVLNREGRLKFDITEANGLLDYTENLTFFYNPLPDEDDSLELNITTVNPIYYVIFLITS